MSMMAKLNMKEAEKMDEEGTTTRITNI